MECKEEVGRAGGREGGREGGSEGGREGEKQREREREAERKRDLLVGLQHIEELEADTHPLLGRDEFGAAVGDAPHQVDAVLLHLRTRACVRVCVRASTP